MFDDMVGITKRSLLGLLIAGLGAGLLLYLVALIITASIVDPLLCNNPDNFGPCQSGGLISYVVAGIISMSVLLFSLVRLGIFRPLLIVIAIFIALWGMTAAVSPLVWYVELFAIVLLTALVTLVFSVLSSHRSFLLSLVAIVIGIIALRLAITL